MADLRWNSVDANFNDVNGAMGNSIRGISQAGTVFGDLRKSILDEEQRAVDNAFREKQFDEQVSQFAATHGLNENELREQIRHNQESERLTGDELALARSEQDQNALFRKDYAEITSSLYGQRDSLDQQITQSKTELEAAQAAGTITPEQLKERQAQLDRLATQRKELSDTAIQASIQREMGMRGWGGDRAIVTPSDNLAATEQDRAVKGVEQSLKTQQAFSDSYSKGSTLITEAIEDADYRQAFGQAYELGVELTKGTGVKPEEVANLLLQNGLRENWLGSGQSATSELEEFISNPSNTTNPIYQQLMLRAGKASSGLGSSDTSEIPSQQKQGDDVDITSLTSLTSQALDYREQQVLQSLPTVESVTKETPEVQTRFDQLYRASYGNMPRSEVPASKLKTLEERALQDARNTIQQMRTKATSQFKDERSRRQRMEAFSSMGNGRYYW